MRTTGRPALKLALLLASTAMALLAAEAALRLIPPLGFRQRGSTLVQPKNVVYDIRADARSRSDQLEARVVHTKNSLGFRGPEPPAAFARRMTIVAVGGSTTECFYLGDGKTWPERLAVRLRDEVPGIWIDNARLDGHSSFGHLLLTRQALVPLRPKVTLYLLGLNDMFTDAPRDLDRVAIDPTAALADRSELVATLLNLDRWRKPRASEDLGSIPKPVALRDRARYVMPAAAAARLWQGQEPRLAGVRRRLEELVALNRGHPLQPALGTQATLGGAGGADRPRPPGSLAEGALRRSRSRCGACGLTALPSSRPAPARGLRGRGRGEATAPRAAGGRWPRRAGSSSTPRRG